MMTRLTIPSVNGSRSILTGSLPATHAAVPSATAAALPQVTRPHSAPVSSAIRRPAASISSSRLTNQRDASVTAACTCGSIRLPPCIVRTLQQFMNGRTPRARYGLVLVLMADLRDRLPQLWRPQLYIRPAAAMAARFRRARVNSAVVRSEEDPTMGVQKQEGEDRP